MTSQRSGPKASRLDERDREVLDRLRQQMLVWRYPTVSISLNGICLPETGLGAYGLVMQYDQDTVEASEAEWETTHHEMELRAVLEALRRLHRPHDIDIYSRSEWLIKCARGDYARGCYLALWAELDRLVKPHLVEWHWIRGSPALERAHALARETLALA